MQAQAAKPQELAVTAIQSLQTVQTLLRAGMGCITYLRDLLPEENFESSLLTTSSDGSISSEVSSSGFLASNKIGSSSRANGFAVTTITRGWSAEADKLLDYLENGIFDAIEKQYLRSFIFAIYLDPEDPNNIIEAYTFNFEYRRIAGTDVVVPIMSLGEDLEKLSLGDGGHSKDPILLASAEGRLPTFKDVKKSLKTLIKTLIQAISQMDALPKRRYATYKAFYYPQTPASYEPPHFRPGDSETDQYFFSTHGKDEVPERWSIGKLETGWHGVNVHVASVSAYLPCAEANSVSPPVQIEMQKQDAQERIIVWDAEKTGRLDSLDEDAEFEDDPDFQQSALLSPGISHDEWVPMGTRNKEGVIVPFSVQPPELGLVERMADTDATSGATQELLFTGRAERVPDCVQHLNDETAEGRAGNLPPTQEVAMYNGCPTDATGSLPPSDFSMQEGSPVTESDVDTQVIHDLMMGRNDSDSSVPHKDTDTIESFPVESPVSYDDIQDETSTLNHGSTDPTVPDSVLDCDCHVSVDGNCVLCEGGCKKWYHIWCMGYHSQRDKRLPKRFICFHCSLRQDKNWEIIKVQAWYEELLGNFSRLALFRRAIKIAEIHAPDSSSAFAKLIECEPIVAAQLFRRLQVEGFIAPRDNDDEIALPNPKHGKKGDRSKVKQQRAVRQKYVFVTASKRGQRYRDYFNPDSAVQLRVMGMEDTVNRASKPTDRTPQAVLSLGEASNAVMGPDVTYDSEPRYHGVQMQTDTQNLVTSPPGYVNNEFKRKANPDTVAEINRELSARKKIKVSVVPAVNLYE
ncbi:HORMA domain-containing protein [Russula emetica]|nr:HORMA domain-containing protein [Russula emetica]